MAEASATAEGELARTPLAHLLVYALDRRLTGAIFLQPPRGNEHVVRLVRGVPVKVRPGDRFALLGEMLLEAGAVDPETLEHALATKGLLGDVLLLAGRIERDVLEKVALEQFCRRMVRLFALPPETTYRYYEDHPELEEYGGDPADVDPLALLWAGLRIHGEVSSMMEGTLARLGDMALRLHPAATVARFALDADEARLFEGLSARPHTLPELSALSFPGMARRFAYALTITRQLDLGTGSVPLGADVVPTSSVRDPAPSPTAVGRMALRSTVHRQGAAAPDAPGDGERNPPVLGRRQREKQAASPADDPPDSGVVTVDPPRPAVEQVESSSTRSLVAPPTMRSPVAPSQEEPRASQPAEDAPTIVVTEGLAPAAENPLAGMSAPELFWLASECLEDRDFLGAVEACEAGLRVAPEDPDLMALDAWARSHFGAADLKALAVELDELLAANDGHVEARYYRGMLRKRLGDEAGSLRDLQRVVEIEPDHEGACQEIATFDAKPEGKDRPSLFGRLFKR